MQQRTSHLQVSSLFLLTALAGIAMFSSAWNSFIQGKEKMLLSLGFLVLFLIGLLAIYFRFLRHTSFGDKNNPENLSASTEPVADHPQPPKPEFAKTREASSDLLRAAFSKSDFGSIGERILKNLAHEFEIVQGVFFILNAQTGKYSFAAAYACTFESPPPDFIGGEGLTGQAIINQKIMTITNLPDSYCRVVSGLGKGKARFLYIIPLVHEKIPLGVIEITCFREIEESGMSLLNQLVREGGLKLSALISHETK